MSCGNFEIPSEGASEFAALAFRVKDTRGVLSDTDKAKSPTLVVGFASAPIVPEGSPSPDAQPPKEEEPGTP